MNVAMYDYREWSPDQRASALRERQQHGFPPHSPPHVGQFEAWRLITAACFEHRHILNGPDRIGWFEKQLLGHLKSFEVPCAAWVVLPNHYHVLVKVSDIDEFVKNLGQLHGRTSFEMNLADGARNRKVWLRCADRIMRSKEHYLTTVNYIHNNPVKHGYVEDWNEWPWSSFHWYLENHGREKLVQRWKDYPLLDYGKKWDSM
jgi:putative transposase